MDEEELAYYDFVQIRKWRSAGQSWEEITASYDGDFDESTITETYARWQKQKANYDDVIRTIKKPDFISMMITVETTDITIAALTQFSYFLNLSVLRDALEWILLLRSDHMRASMSKIGPAFKHCNTKWRDEMWERLDMIKRLIRVIESV